MFNRQLVLAQAEKYDSFYLYDESRLKEAAEKLTGNFKNIHFLYSIKANPNIMVIKSLITAGFGADAASIGEVLLSNKLGLKKEGIYYSAPGKNTSDIEQALDKSIIIADSINEINKIQVIAETKGIVAKIGVRINPNFTFNSNIGIPSKFGIDEKTLFENIELINGLKNIVITGIHVHIQSQELDSKLLIKYYDKVLNLAVRFQQEAKIVLEFINLGAGIGIAYSQNEKEINMNIFGNSVSELFTTFMKELPEVKIFIETGRYVVTKAGVYVTKVVDIKESFGKTYIILNNTLNGFMRPALAQLVDRYSTEEKMPGSEPLFTSRESFDFVVLNNETDNAVVSLVGNLCTATDIIANDILLPKLIVGDIIVITNAGSYGATLSPTKFSSHNPLRELFLKIDGEIEENN